MDELSKAFHVMVAKCPDFQLHGPHTWNIYADYPEEEPNWMRCVGVSAETTPHIGRSWSGQRLEDSCPCPQELCGLIDRSKVREECDQHPPEAAQTIRQGHAARDCPGSRPDGIMNPNKTKEN